MKILAFDTATTACSAALWAAGGVRAERHMVMARGHARMLMPMVTEVLAEAGATLGDVDAFAVTIGPGTYTGLRIGLAAARGLRLAAAKPLIGVTTLAAVAHAAARDNADGRVIAVALETKRADIYAQHFAPDLAPHGEPGAMLPNAAAALLPEVPILVAGDAADRLLAALPGDRDARQAVAAKSPEAGAVAALAARYVADDPALLTAPAPRPLYLRPASVTPQRDGGRVRP